MNLSKWNEYTEAERRGFLLAIVTATQTHIMPPPKYVWMHSNAKVSDAELNLLKEWALAERKPDRNRPSKSRN